MVRRTLAQPSTYALLALGCNLQWGRLLFSTTPHHCLATQYPWGIRLSWPFVIGAIEMRVKARSSCRGSALMQFRVSHSRVESRSELVQRESSRSQRFCDISSGAFLP